MEKILFVSDLDGTLLADDETIPQHAADLLNKMVAQGLLFTYATARSFSTAKKVTGNIHANIPAIVYNGCRIVETGTGRVLSAEKFSTQERADLMLKLLKHKVSPLVYSNIDGVEKVSYEPSSVTYGMKLYLESRAGDPRLRPSSAQDLYEGEIFYLTIIGEKEDISSLFGEISQDSRFHSTFQKDKGFGTYWLEIMPKGATKAEAVLRLKTILGCDKIISFGDAINDLSLFAVSDECYAVENSVEKLKLMSTEVIGSNNDGAVANKIWELFSSD